MKRNATHGNLCPASLDVKAISKTFEAKIGIIEKTFHKNHPIEKRLTRLRSLL